MEPNRKYTPDIEPDIRPDLRSIPGGGETTPGRGDLKSVPNERAKELAAAEKQAGVSNKTPDDIEDQESQGTWNNKVSNAFNPNLNQPKLQKALKFAKKRGGILGLIALFGVGGGILASFLGPASLLINLVENVSLSNDSSSTAMERRFMKVFGNITTADPICASPSSRTIKCTMGRISNSALYRLEKTGGIKANFDAETTNSGKRTGYPSKNPSSYTMSVDGNDVTKPAGEFKQFLVDNPKVAAKVLGRGGAFNLRIQAWSGQFISKKFFKVFSLDRNGGLADGKNKLVSSSKERLAAAYEKLKQKIPASDKLGNYSERLKTKVKENMNKAKKGGVGYTVAVAGCIGLKAPAIIAGTVAAVQLAQVIPAFNSVIASPGAKAKASGYGIPDSITAEDADAIGSILTEKTVPEGGGAASSALDSPILQSSMGVNTNKPALSSKYTPGYGVLLAPATKALRAAQKTTEPACNTVMSPAAMWSAFAVDSAVTVAASATVIGGVIKVLGSIAISEAASYAVQTAISEYGAGIVTALVENDNIPEARGEALGDVLGIGGAAFFSAGGMARGLPTLKEGQLAEQVAMQQENEAFQREMDIASLSPLDASSRYTFLGSIAYNTRMAVIENGSYGNFLQTLSAVGRMPLSIVSPKTNAATNAKVNSCGYADDFGLSLEGEDQPAIGVSGLPCVGLNTVQGNMSSDEAIDLLIKEGWLSESASVSENATMDELVTGGVIVADTPLSDFISTCTNASAGDYLFNAASCTVSSGTEDTSDYTEKTGCSTDAEGEDVCFTAEENGGAGNSGVQNARSLEAMSVFLIDFQIRQSVNGEDEGSGEGTTAAAAATTGTGAVSLPVDTGYKLSDGWIPRSCDGCASFHVAQDFFGGNSIVKSATDGTVLDADKSGSDNNIVRIKAPNGVITEYWHMQGKDILVNAGDTVTAGQQLGVMGCVGVCFGTHLHFMVDVTETTDAKAKAITTRPKGTRTYASPAEWFALYGVSM